MNGVLRFTDNSLVGKQSEYPTKEEFLQECSHEFEIELSEMDINDVEDGYVRYYPRGTEDSVGEFGEGEPVYQFVDKKNRGVFDVWVYSTEKEV